MNPTATLAAKCDTDPATVNTLALMVASRIQQASETTEQAIDLANDMDVIYALLQDSVRQTRRMAIKATVKRQEFADTVYDLVRPF